MQYDNYLNLDPARVSVFDVDVVAASCGSQAAFERKTRSDPWNDPEVIALGDAHRKGAITDEEYLQDLAKVKSATDAAALQSARDVTVGSKVKVELSAPLFDGAIAPVADEIQTFNSPNDIGHWEWQLKPNNPGDFELPLRLTIYDNEGKEALKENDIVNVHVHVARTFGYTVSLVWTAIGNFFSSLQGVIASMAAVFGAMAGLRAWLVRKSKKEIASAPTAAGEAGYL